MRLYKFSDKVIRVQGNAAQFLNGLTANALDKPRNAFVNLHGRIIATVWQERISDDEMLLAVPVVAVDALLGHLNRYAKLSRSQLIATDLKAYMDLEEAKVIIQPDGAQPLVSEEEFTLFRLDRGIPLMGVDYQADEFILNVHEHDYVSYTKGCFLGQEPVAKVHNRSKPSWRLIVKYENECSDEEKSKMTSKSRDPQSGGFKGFVFVKNV